MLSNWLITQCRLSGERVGSSSHPYASHIYSRSIHGRWGMVNPEGTDYVTVQGVDYTAAEGGHEYADAWCVDGARLSRKAAGSGYITNDQFETSFVFVAGPNVGSHGRSTVSTTRRTFNAHMEADYARFREGVKAALYAGLLAMAMMGHDVALLAHVSAGIYAGPHQKTLRAEFGDIVGEILVDARTVPKPLGHYFEKVILTKLHVDQSSGSELPVLAE